MIWKIAGGTWGQVGGEVGTGGVAYSEQVEGGWRAAAANSLMGGPVGSPLLTGLCLMLCVKLAKHSYTPQMCKKCRHDTSGHFG